MKLIVLDYIKWMCSVTVILKIIVAIFLYMVNFFHHFASPESNVIKNKKITNENKTKEQYLSDFKIVFSVFI